jgi:hypothetical protein|nr:MAG TPA: hypothetical protein [Caudoviricetes sp.]
MWNLGDGFAKGIYENHRGLDEKREYEELSKQRELARQRTQQIMDKDKLEMQEMKNKLYLQNIEIQKVLATAEADRGRRDLVNFVETIQKNKGKNVTIEDEIVSPDKLPEGFDPKNYTHNEDGTYTRKIAKYGKSDDILKGEENMNERWVYNTDGARWINNVLNTVDNPVTNVSYDPQQDEINFRLRDGSYISYPPSVVYAATGMDKLGSLSDRNLMEQQRNDFIANQKVIEAKLKNDETQMRVATGYDEARAKMITAGAAARNSEANMLSSQAQMYKAMNPEIRMTDFDKKQADKQRLADTDKKILEMSDGEAYDFIGKDNEMFKRHIAPTASQLQTVQDIQKAQAIGNRLRKFEVFIGQLKNYTGDNTIDDTVAAMITRYLPEVSTEEIKKATNLATFIQSYADQLSADMIQLKSGAAFSETELGMNRDILQSSVGKFQSIDTTLSGVKAFIQNWDALVAGKIGTMDPYKQKYIYGSMEKFEGNINKVTEKQTRIFMEQQIKEIEKASPEEQKKWYSTLSPEMKAMAAKISKERKKKGSK